MFIVAEPTATAIGKAYVESGELSAVVELRRHFPGIVDNEWQPIVVPQPKPVTWMRPWQTYKRA